MSAKEVALWFSFSIAFCPASFSDYISTAKFLLDFSFCLHTNSTLQNCYELEDSITNTTYSILYLLVKRAVSTVEADMNGFCRGSRQIENNVD